MTGFTDTVKLGDLGNAIENANSVMRVWFINPQTERPYRLHHIPYFRGTVLNHYENQSWTLRFDKNLIHHVTPLRAPKPTDGQTIKQRISLDPHRHRTVCAVYPVYELNQEMPVAFDSRPHR